jgi:hypothetical protein
MHQRSGSKTKPGWSPHSPLTPPPPSSPPPRPAPPPPRPPFPPPSVLKGGGCRECSRRSGRNNRSRCDSHEDGSDSWSRACWLMTGAAWAMALRQRTGRRCCSCARTSWGGWGHLMEPTLVRIGFGHVVLRELNLFDSSSPLPRTLFQHAPALPAGPEKAVLKGEQR